MERLAKEIETVVKGAGHHQRLCRAHHRRLLPEHRAGPRAAGPHGLGVGDVAGRDRRHRAGGEMVTTTTVEGRERFGVGVRYPARTAPDPQQIAREGAGADDGG